MLTRQIARSGGNVACRAAWAHRLGANRFPRVAARDKAGLRVRTVADAPASAPKPAEGASASNETIAKTSKAAESGAEPLKKADTVLEALGNFIFDNPGTIAGALMVALIGWLIKSWADDTQRTALEEAINTERIVSGVEWTQLREANRLTVGEFMDIVRACLELFPQGSASGDDFLWVVERVMAESRQKRMHDRADADAARVHLKVSAMRKSEEARRRQERERLVAQNQAATDAAASASRRAWLSALTLGLVAGESPSNASSSSPVRGVRAGASSAAGRGSDGSSWFGGGSASRTQGGDSGGDLFADVYDDEAETSEAFNPSQSMRQVYGDLQSTTQPYSAEDEVEESAEESASASGGTELDLVDLDAWERSLPPLPDPDGAAELALHAALRALPPVSLVHRQGLERLMRALETSELRGDAGVAELGGDPIAVPKPEGVTTPLLKLAQFVEAKVQPGDEAPAAADPSGSEPSQAADEDRARPVPLAILLAVAANLIDESPEGRADALLAVFADEHPLLAGPGSEVALPDGYSALQVDFKRRARTLGFAGTLRGGVSGGVSAVAPDERAVADGVVEGAAAGQDSSQDQAGDAGEDGDGDAARAEQSASKDAPSETPAASEPERDAAEAVRGSLFASDPADLTDEAAGLVAELLEAEAEMPVASEARSSGFPGQEPLPQRPALAPDAVRVGDLVRVVSALQATWQLVPGSVVEREQLVPYPRWKRRGAESAVRAACERLRVTPAEVEARAPRSGCAGLGEKSVEVLSRADAMRVLWSNDVCVWGSCPAETGPLRSRAVPE